MMSRRIARILLGCALAWPVAAAVESPTPEVHAESPEPGIAALRAEAPIDQNPLALPTLDPEGLHRCIGSDGVAMFTDRDCGDLGAIERQRSVPMAPQSSVMRVRTCARNQDDLLLGVRSALEGRDVNRLADFYHWTGMGTTQGYRMLDRLNSFAERPVVDVRLVSSRAQPRVDAFDYGFGGSFDDDDMPEIELDPLDDPRDGNALGDPSNDTEAMPQKPRAPRRARQADLMRVDQMRDVDDAEAQVTYFRVLSNAGCWWVQY